MTAHMCITFDPTCWRCDLNLDEIGHEDAREPLVPPVAPNSPGPVPEVGAGLGDRETPCTQDCNRPRVGSRAEHCRVCHQTFAGTSSGDSHRIGTPGTDGRRCRTVAEMTAGGMWPSDHGGRVKWHGTWNKRGEQKRRGDKTYGEDAA